MADDRGSLLRSLAGSLRVAVLGCFLLIVVAFAVLLLFFRAVAARSETKVDVVWKETGESFSSLKKRVERAHPNEAALLLEDVGASMGFDLRPNVDADWSGHQVRVARGRPPSGSAKDAQRMGQLMLNYIESQIVHTRDEIERAPEAIRSYVESHRDVLKRLHEVLASEEAPKWEADPSGAVLPGFSELLFVERVLLVEALECSAAGDRLGTEARLEEAWKINASLLDRPELIAKVVGYAAGQLHAGVLRRVVETPGQWPGRYDRGDAARSLWLSMQYEALILREAVDAGRMKRIWEGQSRLSQRLLDPVSRPWLRLDMAAYGETMRAVVAALAARGVCRYDFEAARRVWGYVDKPPPGYAVRFQWHPFARAAWSDIRSDAAVPRSPLDLARFLLSQELALKVLELKRVRAAHGTWPRELDTERSQVCPDDGWRYQIDSKGGMSLALSRDFPDWPVNTRKRPPLSFVLECCGN